MLKPNKRTPAEKAKLATALKQNMARRKQAATAKAAYEEDAPTALSHGDTRPTESQA